MNFAFRSLLPNFWILAYATPVLLVLWAILTYGVDTFYGDELFFIPRLVQIAQNDLALADLFALHHNHRPAIPFSLTALFVFTIGWHGPYKYLIAVALALSTYAALHSLARNTFIHTDTKTRTLFTLCAMVYLLSLTQYTIWIQGMFLSIPLLMTCAIWTIYLLWQRITPTRILGALALCTAATLTLHQGFLTWFIALFLISYHKKIHPLVFAWASTAIAVTAFYHTNFTQGRFGSDVSSSFQAPGDLIQFAFAFLGAPLAPTHLAAATVLGGVLVLLAGSMTIRTYMQPAFRTLSLPWIAILLFSGMLAASTAVGRIWLGTHYALRPRYIAMSSVFFLSILALTIIHTYSTSTKRLFHILLSVLIGVNVAYSFLAIPGLADRARDIADGPLCARTIETASDACIRRAFKNGELRIQETREYISQLKEHNLLDAVY